MIALTWDIRQVQNWQELDVDTTEHKVTEYVAWSSIVLGLNTITPTNIGEWWFRLQVWEFVYGQISELPDGRRLLKNDLTARINMKTNSTQISRNKFNESVTEALREKFNG